MATDKCTRCEKCIKKCPVGAIKLIDKRPFWTYKCESCMRCANICPVRAIETIHTFSIGMMVVFYIFLYPLLIWGLDEAGLWTSFSQNEWARNLAFLINTSIILLLFFLIYKLMHFCMRFSFITKFIAYTSFSKYHFWRRYKGLKSNKKS